MKIGDHVKFTDKFVLTNIKDKFKAVFRESTVTIVAKKCSALGVPRYTVAFSDGELFTVEHHGIQKTA